MIHTLRYEQTLHTSLEEAWDFFSSPRNLPKITPPHLDFNILSPLPEKMYAGMMIEYRVRPLLGIPMRWLTEITHVQPGQFFVDEQRVGPYKMWHHEHHFREVSAREVVMTDIITYQLPLTPWSEIVHPFLVKPQLAAIFGHRERVTAGLFAAG